MNEFLYENCLKTSNYYTDIGTSGISFFSLLTEEISKENSAIGIELEQLKDYSHLTMKMYKYTRSKQILFEEI